MFVQYNIPYPNFLSRRVSSQRELLLGEGLVVCTETPETFTLDTSVSPLTRETVDKRLSPLQPVFCLKPTTSDPL